MYHNGQIVRYDEVSFTPAVQGLHYGTGVFEGIRAYWDGTTGKAHVVQARKHWERFQDSARLLRLDVPISVDELVDITLDLLRRNAYRGDVYLRPLAHKLSIEPGGSFGVGLRNVSTAFSVYLVPMPGHPTGRRIRCAVSSWRRVPDTSIPARAKITGSYVNIALAIDEARSGGYDDAILLNQHGTVAEASTANVFVVRGGQLITPSADADILSGITRSCAIELAHQELGKVVAERPVLRSELYTADEVFLTGTGCELVGVGEIDGRPIGNGAVGPITARLADAYAGAVRGVAPRYTHWLTSTDLQAE
jgi:branched-chain amino acid aminotransferase